MLPFKRKRERDSKLSDSQLTIKTRLEEWPMKTNKEGVPTKKELEGLLMKTRVGSLMKSLRRLSTIRRMLSRLNRRTYT